MATVLWHAQCLIAKPFHRRNQCLPQGKWPLNLITFDNLTFLNFWQISRSQSKSFDVDPSEIKRLMGAVSFGYGIFQLCSSLLPSKLLKIFSFLGFTGNQNAGMVCLTFSRSTSDMRAMMATYANRCLKFSQRHPNLLIPEFQIGSAVVLHIRHTNIPQRRRICWREGWGSHTDSGRGRSYIPECRTFAVFSWPIGADEGGRF